jgi:Protein of unknown function (DUF3455)
MKTTFILLASLASLGLTAPTQTTSYQRSPERVDFYSVVDSHIHQAKVRGLTQQPPTCDLTYAVMPVAPAPLPSPEPGLILREVTIGRGVQVRLPRPNISHTQSLSLALQNYTCAVSSPQYTPVAIGAVASLYNASCVAANYPDILSTLPSLALQFPLPPSPSSGVAPSNIDLDLSGHHYFITDTTPVFNLNASTDPVQQLGLVVGNKAATSTAPANATKGQNGGGDGAVAWLYLNTTSATQSDVRAVYRVNTAGGNPPATCEGSDAVFSVQYAAEYWFYSKP